MSLPTDVPWKLIAASPDMMDVTFCDKEFPPAWHSSLAIYAYEPDAGDLPTQYCDQIITYLKITCSITGYQPSQEEVGEIGTLSLTSGVPGAPNNLQAPLPNIPGDVIEDLIGDYYACYGVLLNVAVFSEAAHDLSTYPHIIDFEPKTRDLYQVATDQAEVLTASKSGINTGKSLANTASSEMGLSGNADVSGTIGVASAGIKGGLTSQWGNTESDGSTSQIDRSRERRETQGVTTNITQQYNLMTGYHAGTNRVTFLMLPRPHSLQATDFRTFVRGLRMIEGMQEFFLIVSRPKSARSLCIEASLETGHFPETVTLGTVQSITSPIPQTTSYPYTVTAFVTGGTGGSQYSNNPAVTPPGTPQPYQWSVPIPDNWVLDTSQGGPTTLVVNNPPSGFSGPPNLTLCPGVSCTINPNIVPNTDMSWYAQALNTLLATVTATLDGSTLTFSVVVNSSGGYGSGASALLNFTIFVKQVPQTSSSTGSLDPADYSNPDTVVVSPFIVASRQLCVCMDTMFGKSAGPTQLVGAKTNTVSSKNAKAAMTKTSNTIKAKLMGSTPSSKSSIVYETKLGLPRNLLNKDGMKGSRTPAARELMYKIHHHMLSSWRLPQRRPHKSSGFIESDYVCHRLLAHMPKAYLTQHISKVKGLPPKVVKALGPKTMIVDVLKLDLYQLKSRMKSELDEAIKTRRKLLGLADKNTKRKSRHRSKT